MSALPIQLRNLPPASFRPLSIYYSDLSRQLANYADDYERGTGGFQWLQQDVGSSRGIADMVQEYLTNGQSKDAAYRSVAQLTGETLETVKWAWRAKFGGAEQDRAAKAKAAVYKWHNAGLKPPQIAAITKTPVTTIRLWLKDAA